MSFVRQFKVISNRALAKQVYEMTLAGDTSGYDTPGQFVNIAVPGFYLRRPISICERSGSGLTLVYKAVGLGTEALSGTAPGAALELLGPLGNGFSAPGGIRRPLLVGGGVGTPPMLWLMRRLRESGLAPKAVLGWGSEDEVFYTDEFSKYGEIEVCTIDGSRGTKGFVTDAGLMRGGGFDYIYACGPLPMLKAVYLATETGGQYSFEQRMACGFGACMGCTCRTNSGAKRICKDGPVLSRDDIVWEGL